MWECLFQLFSGYVEIILPFPPSLQYLNKMSLHYNIFFSIRFPLCLPLSFLILMVCDLFGWEAVGERMFFVKDYFLPSTPLPSSGAESNIWRLLPSGKQDTILCFTKRQGIFLLSYHHKKTWSLYLAKLCMLFVWII